MELEQFIEEDMRSFLDQRQAEAYSAGTPAPTRQDDILEPEEVIYAPARDFAKELDAALAEHDLAKARRILFSLKESYDRYPPDAPERAEQRELLQSLYIRFQGALRTDRALQAEALAEGGRFIPAASAPAQPQEAPRPPPKPIGLSPQEERALAADITQIETLLAEGSVGAAMRVYHVVRRNLSAEQMTQEQRSRVIPRLRAAYDEIVKRLASASAATSPARSGATEAPRPLPEGAAQLFREHAAAAERAAAAQDPAEAIRQYREMRSLYSGLPAGEQQAAMGTLQTTYRRIEGLLHTQPGPQPGAVRVTTRGASQSGEGGAVLDDEERRLVGAP
jgi:hypothetical protein